jgi:hypothetical protein
VVSITLAYVPLDLILPDQPNRAVRTRMLRGVGGAACEGRSYPDILDLLDFSVLSETNWNPISIFIIY